MLIKVDRQLPSRLSMDLRCKTINFIREREFFHRHCDAKRASVNKDVLDFNCPDRDTRTTFPDD